MTKYDLRQYKRIRTEIEQLQRLLEETESRVYDPGLPQLTGLPGGHSSRAGSTQERRLDSALSLLDHYRARLEALCAFQLRIEQIIDGLVRDQRLVLRYRYIQDLHWDEICDKMHVSWATVHRIHAAALQQVQGFSVTCACP